MSLLELEGTIGNMAGGCGAPLGSLGDPGIGRGGNLPICMTLIVVIVSGMLTEAVTIQSSFPSRCKDRNEYCNPYGFLTDKTGQIFCRGL